LSIYVGLRHTPVLSVMNNCELQRDREFRHVRENSRVVLVEPAHNISHFDFSGSRRPGAFLDPSVHTTSGTNYQSGAGGSVGRHQQETSL
jgi:hypothetical protein